MLLFFFSSLRACFFSFSLCIHLMGKCAYFLRLLLYRWIFFSLVVFYRLFYIFSHFVLEKKWTAEVVEWRHDLFILQCIWIALLGGHQTLMLLLMKFPITSCSSFAIVHCKNVYKFFFVTFDEKHKISNFSRTIFSVGDGIFVLFRLAIIVLTKNQIIRKKTYQQTHQFSKCICITQCSFFDGMCNKTRVKLFADNFFQKLINLWKPLLTMTGVRWLTSYHSQNGAISTHSNEMCVRFFFSLQRLSMVWAFFYCCLFKRFKLFGTYCTLLHIIFIFKLI